MSTLSQVEQLTEQGKQIPFCINTEYYLKQIGLDWQAISQNLPISRAVINSWLNGHKVPSLDKVEQIASFIKQSGNKLLFTPKQLIGETPFDLSSSVAAKSNAVYLMREYKIMPADLIKEGFSRNHVYAIFRDAKQPGYDMLQKLVSYFKKRGLPVRSVLDLIYFPTWGESQATFLVYRRLDNKS